jgi:hypothetical protein
LKHLEARRRELRSGIVRTRGSRYHKPNPTRCALSVQARLYLSHCRVLLALTDTPRKSEFQSDLFGRWLDTDQHSAVHQMLLHLYGDHGADCAFTLPVWNGKQDSYRLGLSSLTYPRVRRQYNVQRDESLIAKAQAMGQPMQTSKRSWRSQSKAKDRRWAPASDLAALDLIADRSFLAVTRLGVPSVADS